MVGNVPRIVQVLKYLKRRKSPGTVKTPMVGVGVQLTASSEVLVTGAKQGV